MQYIIKLKIELIPKRSKFFRIITLSFTSRNIKGNETSSTMSLLLLNTVREKPMLEYLN